MDWETPCACGYCPSLPSLDDMETFQTIPNLDIDDRPTFGLKKKCQSSKMEEILTLDNYEQAQEEMDHNIAYGKELDKDFTSHGTSTLPDRIDNYAAECLMDIDEDQLMKTYPDSNKTISNHHLSSFATAGLLENEESNEIKVDLGNLPYSSIKIEQEPMDTSSSIPHLSPFITTVPERNYREFNEIALDGTFHLKTIYCNFPYFKSTFPYELLSLIDGIKKFLTVFPMKWYLTLNCKFKHSFRNFSTDPVLCCRKSERDDQIFSKFAYISNSIENSANDPNLEPTEICSLEISFCLFNPLSGPKSPPVRDRIKKCRTILKITQLNDKDTFWYCIAAKLYPANENQQRSSKYKKYVNEIKTGGVPSPVHVDDITEVENANPDLSVNVIGYREEEDLFFPLRLTKKMARDHVDLLYIKTKGHDSHRYCLIKNFESLFKFITNHHDKKFFCRFCLKHFSKKPKRDNHIRNCKMISNEIDRADYLPMKFNPPNNFLPVPYFMTLNLYSGEGNKILGYHIVVVNENGEVEKRIDNRVDADAEEAIFNDLKALEREYCPCLQSKSSHFSMTADDTFCYQKSRLCKICKSPMGSDKVKNFSLHGKYLFASHKHCQPQRPNVIPVLCDDASRSLIIGYFSNLKSPVNFQILGKDFAPFTLSKLSQLRFIDIYQFIDVDVKIFLQNLKGWDFGILKNILPHGEFEEVAFEKYDEILSRDDKTHSDLDLLSLYRTFFLAESFQYLRHICWEKLELDPGNYPFLKDCVKDSFLNFLKQESEQPKDLILNDIFECDPKSLLDFLPSFLIDKKMVKEVLSDNIPTGEYKMLTDDEIHNFDLNLVTKDDNYGYILSITLSEHFEAGDFFLTSLEKDEVTGQHKLVVHYRLLQFFINMGLKNFLINKILRFTQKKFLKGFVDRLESNVLNPTPNFILNFYENINTNFKNVSHNEMSLHWTKETAKIGESSFKRFKILNDGLVGIESSRGENEIFSSVIAFAIADLSKLFVNIKKVI